MNIAGSSALAIIIDVPIVSFYTGSIMAVKEGSDMIDYPE